MAEWSYPATDFVTGRLITEHLPLTGVSFSDALDDGGTLTGRVPVDAAALGAPARDFLARMVVWPCANGVPTLGPYTLTGLPSTGLDSPDLSLVCSRFDEVFDARPIMDNLVFSAMDPFSVGRDLLRYGAGLGTLHTTPTKPPPSWSGVAAIPWMRVGDKASGADPISRTRVVNGQDDDGFRSKDGKHVGPALRDLAKDCGFEYRFQPATDGAFYVTVDFGYPTVGNRSDFKGAPVFEYPGGNIITGAYAADGSDLFTRVEFIGGEVGTTVLRGTATSSTLHTAGYPMRVKVVSDSQITSQSELTARAARHLAVSSVLPDGLTLELDGETDPIFGSYGLGDYVTVRIERGASGVVDERNLRIVGLTVKPSDTGFGERVTPTFAEVG